MSSSPFPVQFTDGCAVVSLPREIDVLNVGTVGAALLAALGLCSADVVADMTATSFSDAAGIRAVVRAHHRAEELGCWVRAVIPHPGVRRVAALTGAESLLHTYLSTRSRAATRSQMSTTWERLAVTCTDIAAIHERLAQRTPGRRLAIFRSARRTAITPRPADDWAANTRRKNA